MILYYLLQAKKSETMFTQQFTTKQKTDQERYFAFKIEDPESYKRMYFYKELSS